jgi:hypothetical protein
MLKAADQGKINSVQNHIVANQIAAGIVRTKLQLLKLAKENLLNNQLTETFRYRAVLEFFVKQSMGLGTK